MHHREIEDVNAPERAEPATSDTPKRSVRKTLLIVAGVICVALATLGVFVPLLPTTPFLLLAGAAFTRSSDRLYDWLMSHPWFGTYIRNYREHRAITLQTKILAITLLWSTIVYAALAVVESRLVRGLLIAIAVGVTVHLLSLRTLTRAMIKAQREQAQAAPQEEAAL